MLLDSNLIIYAARPEHSKLRDFIAATSPAVSVISYIEVLGYHLLTAEDRKVLQRFFDSGRQLPISQPVIERATALRQQRRMSLGDALIAATALVHDLSLITHNAADFRWVPELRIVDPLA